MLPFVLSEDLAVLCCIIQVSTEYLDWRSLYLFLWLVMAQAHGTVVLIGEGESVLESWLWAVEYLEQAWCLPIICYVLFTPCDVNVYLCIHKSVLLSLKSSPKVWGCWHDFSLDGDERVWQGEKEEEGTNSKFLRSPFSTSVMYLYVPVLKSHGRSSPAPQLQSCPGCVITSAFSAVMCWSLMSNYKGLVEEGNTKN